MVQEAETGRGLRVFISYAHEDHAYKETLLDHLSGLTRRGVVAPWADHAIDAGQDWHSSIVEAMDSCHMALLLVSAHFIKSDFIHSQELSRLLARRERDGIRVVPIIARPCRWQSEVIGQLQALPEGGQPIVILDRLPGGSDEAWADIAAKIEVWAAEFGAGNGKPSDPSSTSNSSPESESVQPDPVVAALTEAGRLRAELEAAQRELQASREALQADRAKVDAEAQDIAQRRLEVELMRAEAEKARQSATVMQRQEAEKLQREADAAQRKLDADRESLEAERRRIQKEAAALEARKAALHQPDEPQEPLDKPGANPPQEKKKATEKKDARDRGEVLRVPRTESAERPPGTVFRDKLKDGSAGPEMVVIPAGSFRMGDLSGKGDADERPVHTVHFKRPFALGRYTVTFDEYDRFARATGLPLPSDNGWGRGRRPVINVSWHYAVAYAAWLSEQTGAHYRLPSEAEWEYAARAGTETEYWWGDEFSRKRANGKTSLAKALFTMFPGSTVSVDDSAYSANPWGLFHVSGNVREWVQDNWHGDYAAAPENGSVWQGGNADFRVVRGGSWFNDPQGLRSAFRIRDATVVAINDQGFRIARDM